MTDLHYTWQQYADKPTLANTLAQHIAAIIHEAIAKKGRAFLAFSGGSTPIQLFKALQHQRIPWQQVSVTLVDERWVDPSSEKSNEKLIFDNLLHDIDGVHFIPLKRDGLSRQQAIAQITDEISELGALDLAILGMGGDAHTASFFPNAPELNEAFHADALLLASTATVEPYERITFSRAALLRASTLILHMEGEEKRQVFLDALTQDDSYTYPILSMLQPLNSTVKVYYAP